LTFELGYFRIKGQAFCFAPTLLERGVNILKQKIFRIIDEELNDNTPYNIIDVFLTTLIMLNVICIVVESFLPVKSDFLSRFEVFSVIVFTLDYILRVWTSDLKDTRYTGIKSKIKFILSPMGLIDFISFAPFYLTLFLPIAIDGRIFRALRLLRLLRILKLSRYIDSFLIIKNVFKQRKHELIMTGFLAFLLIVISSTLMFEIEHDAQPDKFPDILTTFWWAIATLTTIGYGDVYPITGSGKLLSAIISLIGIGFIALPTGIISSSLLDEYRNTKTLNTEIAAEPIIKSNEEKLLNQAEEYKYCPHCGKKIH
jgi:voltage-gated potassium channel